MTKFRPCIDLHQGKVKQIVGGSLTKDQAELKTNFASDRTAAEFAKLYAKDGLMGGHLIMLGPENKVAALEAIQAYPKGFQVGGGISIDNAKSLSGIENSALKPFNKLSSYPLALADIPDTYNLILFILSSSK